MKLTVSETNCPGCSDTASSVASKVHSDPADNDRHGAVTATSDKEEGTVLRVVIALVGDVQQNSVPGHRDEHGDESKAEAVLHSIREVRDAHGEPESGSPWRNRVQLCLDGWAAVSICMHAVEKEYTERQGEEHTIITVSLDDSRCKVRITWDC